MKKSRFKNFNTNPIRITLISSYSDYLIFLANPQALRLIPKQFQFIPKKKPPLKSDGFPLSRRRDSNPRPADYKSAALAN